MVYKEILAELRNKLTVPKTALLRMDDGKPVPKQFLELALKELKAAEKLLKEIK